MRIDFDFEAYFDEVTQPDARQEYERYIHTEVDRILKKSNLWGRDINFIPIPIRWDISLDNFFIKNLRAESLIKTLAPDILDQRFIMGIKEDKFYIIQNSFKEMTEIFYIVK